MIQGKTQMTELTTEEKCECCETAFAVLENPNSTPYQLFEASVAFKNCMNLSLDNPCLDEFVRDLDDDFAIIPGNLGMVWEEAAIVGQPHLFSGTGVPSRVGFLNYVGDGFMMFRTWQQQGESHVPGAYFSVNGSNWSQFSAPTLYALLEYEDEEKRAKASQITSFAYANGMYVVGGICVNTTTSVFDDSCILTSPSRFGPWTVAWQTNNTDPFEFPPEGVEQPDWEDDPLLADPVTVIYGAGRFLAYCGRAGFRSYTHFTLSSSDGFSNTSIIRNPSGQEFSFYPETLKYMNGHFIAKCLEDGPSFSFTPFFLISQFGTNWTRKPCPSIVSSVGTDFVYANGFYVAIRSVQSAPWLNIFTHEILESEDLESWSIRGTMSISMGDNGFSSATLRMKSIIEAKGFYLAVAEHVTDTGGGGGESRVIYLRAEDINGPWVAATNVDGYDYSTVGFYQSAGLPVLGIDDRNQYVLLQRVVSSDTSNHYGDDHGILRSPVRIG